MTLTNEHQVILTTIIFILFCTCVFLYIMLIATQDKNRDLRVIIRGLELHIDRLKSLPPSMRALTNNIQDLKQAMDEAKNNKDL